MWIFTTDLGYIKSMGGQKNGVLQISKTCSPSGKTQNKQGSLSHLSQISGEHSKVYRNQVNTQSEKNILQNYRKFYLYVYFSPHSSGVESVLVLKWEHASFQFLLLNQRELADLICRLLYTSVLTCLGDT